MINLDLRSPLHWSTAWARRVGAHVAVLVDLIAAHCHEALGVSSAGDLREPLRDVLRCRNDDALISLGISLEEQKRLDREAAIARRLPKWWRKFAGFERWCHDGTYGFAVDRPWMFKHWPASVVIEIVTFKVSASIEAFTASIDKLVKRINSMSALVLPPGLEFEFIPSAEREGPRAELGLPPFVMQARSHGKRAAMRAEVDRAKAEGHDVLIIDDVAPIPSPGAYARIEAQRRALARDFPGFARRYFDTGHMKRSVRMGENAGINALTGELTVWLPEPEEAEATQEPLRELNVPEGADLELSGPVWGPSPTRELFRQMRARRKEHRVKRNWRVVIALPIADGNDDMNEAFAQQIAAGVIANVDLSGIEDEGGDPADKVKILCTDEGDNIVNVPLVEPDEASALKPAPGEPGEPASGDEIKEDGTAPDLEEDAEEATE